MSLQLPNDIPEIFFSGTFNKFYVGYYKKMSPISRKPKLPNFFSQKVVRKFFLFLFIFHVNFIFYESLQEIIVYWKAKNQYERGKVIFA
jgi:hypothetical protein